jgi:hypothetical protein
MAEGKNLYETVIVTSAKLGEEGSALSGGQRLIGQSGHAAHQGSVPQHLGGAAVLLLAADRS